MESPYKTFLDERGPLKRALSPASSRRGKGYSEFVNFSSNDALGLSMHPHLMDKAVQWMKKYGMSFSSSRLVTGDVEDIHVLEARLAAFKKSDAALILNSGFQANVSLIPALMDKNALVFSDRLNHASLQLGFQAAQIKQIRYRHLDLDHLASKLEEYKNDKRPKFIVTESVFSMDGDQVDLSRLVALKKEFNAFLYLDEAHSFGVMGKGGAGLSIAYAKEIDLVLSTFGKAAGGFGAFVCCSSVLKEYLINTCAGFIYATALPPQVFGVIEGALDILPNMDEQRLHVQSLARYFREELKAKGFDVRASTTHIVPVVLGDVEKTMQVSEALKESGVWVNAIRPPTVPKESSRLRFSIMASHDKKDIDHILNVLEKFA